MESQLVIEISDLNYGTILRSLIRQGFTLTIDESKDEFLLHLSDVASLSFLQGSTLRVRAVSLATLSFKERTGCSFCILCFADLFGEKESTGAAPPHLHEAL